MTDHRFHVGIVGGGIGGLALAQGLAKAGLSVAVYERDRSSTDRLQGSISVRRAAARSTTVCRPHSSKPSPPPAASETVASAF